MLRNDVLIENNKYGYITMQNNRALAIINFMHVLTAETRRSFHPFVNAGYEDIMLICLQVHCVWCTTCMMNFVAMHVCCLCCNSANMDYIALCTIGAIDLIHDNLLMCHSNPNTCTIV